MTKKSIKSKRRKIDKNPESVVPVKSKSNYDSILEHIFRSNYIDGAISIDFTREQIESSAKSLGIPVPKNLGDVPYAYKFRKDLPASIVAVANDKGGWVIENVGRSKYRFSKRANPRILPDALLEARKIPDSTPSIVKKYTSTDEQALLTRLRYNRLLDLFTSSVCHSLQNHLRTTVDGIGQIETDEIYVGVDRLGKQYVFPVQAKGGRDKLGIVQIEQDIRLCNEKFPKLICRAIAAQFISTSKIAMFEFSLTDEGVRKVSEKHYDLVEAADIDDETLEYYSRSQE